MRTVRDSAGTIYLLLDATTAECRVRRLPDGPVETVPSDELEAIDPQQALDAAGLDDVDLERASRVDRAVGLLIELEARGPTSVRTLLDRLDICESDLHGAVTELRAAGFVEPTTVYGDRGYRTTAAASEALEPTD